MCQTQESWGTRLEEWAPLPCFGEERLSKASVRRRRVEGGAPVLSTRRDVSHSTVPIKTLPHSARPSPLEPTRCVDGTIREEGEAQQRQLGTAVLGPSASQHSDSPAHLSLLLCGSSCCPTADWSEDNGSGPTLLWQHHLQWWSLFCIILINTLRVPLQEQKECSDQPMPKAAYNRPG